MPSLASRARTSREPWARWREVPYFARPSAANRPQFGRWPCGLRPDHCGQPVEEGTPFIPAHGSRRITFVPKPSGYRFYHTHVRAGANLGAGQYTGMGGPGGAPGLQGGV